MTDKIGNRMKNNYERASRHYLTRRTPVIIRIDGKAFSTFTKSQFKEPFDYSFSNLMQNIAIKLCEQVQNVKLAYSFSDEISLLLIDYDNLRTEQWFDGNIQKMASVSASIASAEFTSYINNGNIDVWGAPKFDARVFNIPEAEVVNYFIWRQKDCERNARNAFVQQFFSEKDINRLGFRKAFEEAEKRHAEESFEDNILELYRKGFTTEKHRYTINTENGEAERTEWRGRIAPDFVDNREYIKNEIPQ